VVSRFGGRCIDVRRPGARDVSTTWIALLRGINVGRNKRIAMGDLRAMLDSLGYTDVRTLLQSGNALFTATTRKPETLERDISSGIKATFGMDVAVMVRTAADFASAVDANPFVAQGVASSELHASFLSAAAPAAKLKEVDRDACVPDEFAVGTRVIYLRLRNGVMGSRLPDWDKVLGVRATTRNWNTTVKLRELTR
jgi:uncharacterized protein (DUF1697 family)